MMNYEDPEAESTLILGTSGGGLFTVSRAAHVSSHCANGFDRQTKPGSNFGRSKPLGVIPAVFRVTFVVLPEDEQTFWNDIHPLFRPKGPAGAIPPLDVVNPNINRTGVDTVNPVDIDVDPPHPRRGRIVTITLEEWTPAPVTPREDPQVNAKTDRNPLGLTDANSAANQ